METNATTVELQIHDNMPKTLLITGDGTVIFKLGIQTKTIKTSPEKVKELTNFMESKNFFSWKEQIINNSAEDAISQTIILSKNGKSHSVFCDDSCPKEFEEVVEKIKSLWPEKIEYLGFA